MRPLAPRLTRPRRSMLRRPQLDPPKTIAAFATMRGTVTLRRPEPTRHECSHHPSRSRPTVRRSLAFRTATLNSGKSFEVHSLSKHQKGPVSRAFRVAGAGFEPATTGL